MKKDFKIGKEAQDKLTSALEEIAHAVGSTMGPGGRPFGFDKRDTSGSLSSTFSKDGITVLKSLFFDEPAYQAVLQYCKQAAGQSVLASGDGTTSSIVLANAVAKAVRESGAKYPQAFARLIESDAQLAIDAIKKEAIISDDVVEKVALTSTNGDKELTSVVLDAIKHSSAFGTLLVEKNPASPVRYRILRQDGYSNCAGYAYNQTVASSASPAASASKPIEWENPSVLIFNGNLIVAGQIDSVLKAWNDRVNGTGEKYLIIVSYEVSDEVANKILVFNRNIAKYDMAAFVVKPRLTAEVNSSLQVIRDIAAYCGIDEDKIVDGGNYKELDASFFGTCGKVKISNNNTMFLGRAKNHWVEKRILQNQSIIEEARSEFDRQITGIRNAELAEGLVKVEVGGGLMPDLQERADRFDDASKAAQACMRGGALPGAGASYIRAGVLSGAHPLLAKAFMSVYKTVMQNYGVDPNENYIPAPGKTYSISEDGIVYGDAQELGILDATETVCSVIKNGVSLGVKVATIGGYSYRSKDEQTMEYE